MQAIYDQISDRGDHVHVQEAALLFIGSAPPALLKNEPASLGPRMDSKAVADTSTTGVRSPGRYSEGRPELEFEMAELLGEDAETRLWRGAAASICPGN